MSYHPLVASSHDAVTRSVVFSVKHLPFFLFLFTNVIKPVGSHNTATGCVVFSAKLLPFFLPLFQHHHLDCLYHLPVVVLHNNKHVLSVQSPPFPQSSSSRLFVSYHPFFVATVPSSAVSNNPTMAPRTPPHQPPHPSPPPPSLESLVAIDIEGSKILRHLSSTPSDLDVNTINMHQTSLGFTDTQQHRSSLPTPSGRINNSKTGPIDTLVC